MKTLCTAVLIFGLAIFTASGGSTVSTDTLCVLPEISGVVVYGNPIPAETRYVPKVKIHAMGLSTREPRTEATTGAHGEYRLSVFSSDSYTVVATKKGDAKRYVNSFDAAKIISHVTGRALLTGNQLIVADVSGNGVVQSYDAALIGAYVVSKHPSGLTGTWKFLPEYRTYPSITNSITNQNYTALLMGEVSGNWRTHDGERVEDPVPESIAAIIAPSITVPAGSAVIVPVKIEGAKDKGIVSYEFELRYDPSVITPQTAPIGIEGTVSRGLAVAYNSEEVGLLRVAVYGATPVNGDGTLLKIKFNAVGTPGSVSPLVWERVMLNEGDPGATLTDGQVELSSPEDRF